MVTYIHFPLKKLPQADVNFIKANFPFYNKLDVRKQQYFNHRVAFYLQNKEFIGKENLVVTQDMKLRISATAVMLTFGMRDYTLKRLERFLIYPSIYYSNINHAYHKGEYNTRYKALIFSWQDLMKGFDVHNDNLNLAIHELMHVLQINSYNNSSINASLFKDYNQMIEEKLKNKAYREKLVNSKYFRDYAFTNRFEFLAVLVENFIETPQTFKEKFPFLYNDIKKMLNFNFAGY
ncbi:zinc-dependent peptidase [Mesonia sp. K7]|uniref:zinc-dependent peptidase n=1 Tax=Mesonia sp. K7 TaxID=2218606 RepID=UPI0011B42E22|nr:zinc-dependent peptidase [Mesonia sp. K7]